MSGLSSPQLVDGEYTASEEDPPLERYPDGVDDWVTFGDDDCDKCGRPDVVTASLMLADGNLVMFVHLCADCLREGIKQIDEGPELVQSKDSMEHYEAGEEDPQ